METIKSTSLFYKDGNSDKEYNVQILKEGDKFTVNFQYGRRNGTLQTGTKTPTAVSEAEAEKIYNKLVKEKMGKGYAEVDGGNGSGFSGPAIEKKETYGIFPQLLNTIEDEEVKKYINDDKYLAQEKQDGERRMAVSGALGRDVIGLNKKGQQVQLPDVIVKSIQEECIIDGEIVGEKLFVFDLIAIGGNDVRHLQLAERIRILSSVSLLAGNIEVVKTAHTKLEKQKLYNELKARNAEGIVFKLKDSKYTAGRPNSGGAHLKNKFYKEASFIVKDLTKGKRSVGLELLTESGDRVFMGKCTVPPNKEIPAVGSVVEVRYLYAYKGGAIFQPTYKDKRNDVDIEECVMSQIIYKEGQED